MIIVKLIQLSWGKDWFDLPSITYRTEILQKNHIANLLKCFLCRYSV